MRYTRRKHIKDIEYEATAELSIVIVTFGKTVIATVGQTRTHSDNRNTLTCIREHLRSGNQDDVIVRITGNRRLIGRFERFRTVFAEVHVEISQILDDYHIILRSHSSDDFQLFFIETHPCRIVRIGVDHTTDSSG